MKTFETLAVNRQTLSFKKSKISIESEIDKFLSFQTSEKTRVSYENHIKHFLKYLDERNLDFRNLTVDNVDSYLLSILSTYSSRTVRLKLATLSSFYKNLIIRHPEVFIVNVFHKRKLPAIKDQFEKDFVTESELNVIKKRLTELNRKDVVTVIDLLNKYGFRVGIFTDMKIDDKNNWTSVSKGEEKKGRFTKKEVNLIYKYKILETKVSIFQNAFNRVSKVLHSQRLINCKPSLHDIRRKVILDEVKENGGLAFLETSQKYHKNPLTTFGYIKTYKSR